jgi:hypothetical protein
MAAPQHARSNGGAAVANPAEQPLQQLSLTERKRRLAEVLVAKTEQGYEIESQTDTEATLVTKGQRRWFGMVGSSKAEIRQITSVDEQGRTRTRPA